MRVLLPLRHWLTRRHTHRRAGSGTFPSGSTPGMRFSPSFYISGLILFPSHWDTKSGSLSWLAHTLLTTVRLMAPPIGKNRPTTPFCIGMWRMHSFLSVICAPRQSSHPQCYRSPPLPLSTSASAGGTVSKSGTTGSSSSHSPACKRCYNCRTYIRVYRAILSVWARRDHDA